MSAPRVTYLEFTFGLVSWDCMDNWISSSWTIIDTFLTAVSFHFSLSVGRLRKNFLVPQEQTNGFRLFDRDTHIFPYLKWHDGDHAYLSFFVYVSFRQQAATIYGFVHFVLYVKKKFRSLLSKVGG